MRVCEFVCVCVWMCVCVPALPGVASSLPYTFICAYTFTVMCQRIYLHAHVQISFPLCMCLRVCPHVRVCVRVRVRVYYTCVCYVRVSACVYVCAVCVHVNVHIVCSEAYPPPSFLDPDPLSHGRYERSNANVSCLNKRLTVHPPLQD